tara:strand:+ start:468 stop:1034 length:567 start_codon:yes stop_codon:yes gene_type:complete
MDEALHADNIVAAVRLWLDSFVIKLNLCPFAKRELAEQRLHFALSEASDESQLLADLRKELLRLNRDSAIETTLLIHPRVLTSFTDYNQFLSDADDLIRLMHLEGVYQIASFHPDYCFSGCSDSDAENFSNRSPYPMLHLLREQSLEQAIAGYVGVEKIPQRNIEKMNTLGTKKLQQMLQSCIDASKS